MAVLCLRFPHTFVSVSAITLLAHNVSTIFHIRIPVRFSGFQSISRLSAILPSFETSIDQTVIAIHCLKETTRRGVPFQIVNGLVVNSRSFFLVARRIDEAAAGMEAAHAAVPADAEAVRLDQQGQSAERSFELLQATGAAGSGGARGRRGGGPSLS